MAKQKTPKWNFYPKPYKREILSYDKKTGKEIVAHELVLNRQAHCPKCYTDLFMIEQPKFDVLEIQVIKTVHYCPNCGRDLTKPFTWWELFRHNFRWLHRKTARTHWCIAHSVIK